MRPVFLAAFAALMMAACHEPEQPPVPPPTPINPTNVKPGRLELGRTGEVIDASILSEARAPLDAAFFQLEATPAQAAAH
jgi:hypothetical protein